MGFINFILIICLNLPAVASQCTLPIADGEWISTSRGTWTVSNGGTQISNFQADLSISVTTTTLNCTATGSSSDQYILSTNFELFFNVFIDVYTCLEIVPTDQAPYSYIYYVVTATDATTGEQFTSDQSTACSNSGFQTGANLNILTQTATIENATINFPNIILGNYSLVYEDIDSAQETDWLMDSCNDTKLLSFTHATSTTQVGFTATDAPNLLQCLYSVTEGSNVYVFMYNNGTQDGSTSYSYTCWVFATSGSDVVATAFPNTCQATQTASSVTYGGEKFTFTPFFVCPLTATTEEEAGGLAGWIIALIVLAVVLLIAIAVVTFIYCYMRKSRNGDDENGKPFAKEGERQPSPDSIRDVDLDKEKKKAKEESKKNVSRTFRRKAEDYDNDIDKEKARGKQLDREQTMDLKEVTEGKGQKLKDGRPSDTAVDTQLKPEGMVKPKEVIKPTDTINEKELTKQQKKEEQKRQAEERKKEEARKKEEKKKEEVRRKEEAKQKEEEKKKEEAKKKEEEKKQKEESQKVGEPTGKQSIPPTTPKPEDDKALLKIKKERERREKEKVEKKKQEEKRKKDALHKEQKEIKPEERVIKTVLSTSSEYETDESEEEERKQKLIEKRKRLIGASYEPIDGMLGDASVVGRKKRRHRHFEDGGDTSGKLVSREDDEQRIADRRERRKRLKRMAKQKIKGHEHAPTSDSETETRGRKKRRAGDPRGIEAPYIEQYFHKKDIEEELDQSHYWDGVDETQQIEDDPLATPKVVSESELKAEQRAEEEVVSPSKMEIEIKDEDADADHIRVGPNDDLPEGYQFDKKGNIIRVSDGKVVMTQSQVEQKRKFGNVFSLPRLIRDGDGRPLGGYKDDEFGPTAEWDWGDAIDAKETEADQGKSEVPTRTVAFNMTDDLSTVPATPLNELDSSQRKGRQLGSADRELLRARLFEQQQQQRAKAEHPTSLPIYFSGSKGVKDSGYIDNTQIEKQDPNALQRSQSVRVSGKGNMVIRSDTFDDGRPGRDKRHGQVTPLRRGKLRATWTAASGGIPEETELPDTQMPNRNIGSYDEFILVGGSVNTLNPQNQSDSKLPPRSFPSTRERSSVSDINMKTAPDSPQILGDRKLRRYAGEFIPDQRFFNQYIDTENLPTNASAETRALANQGLEFIYDRTSYWQSKEPEPSHPPPSDLGLRLMRMSTFYTTADSGLESRMSTMTSRPKSASDANDNIASSRLSQRESTIEQLTGRNQQQVVRQLHGQTEQSNKPGNHSGVQKVKVKPGDEK